MRQQLRPGSKSVEGCAVEVAGPAVIVRKRPARLSGSTRPPASRPEGAHGDHALHGGFATAGGDFTQRAWTSSKQQHIGCVRLWVRFLCGSGPVGQVLWVRFCGSDSVGQVMWVRFSCGSGFSLTASTQSTEWPCHDVRLKPDPQHQRMQHPKLQGLPEESSMLIRRVRLSCGSGFSLTVSTQSTQWPWP